MKIAGMIKSSLIDYPGLVSCVLFVPGCNYNCFYCHNRSLIDGSHVIIDPRVVTGFLQKRAGLLDGVVITGGEPTLQRDLPEYLDMIKGMGYKIKLDTNGSSPAIVERILDASLCDYFAVDYKAPQDRYKEICGGEADGEAVLEAIGLLLSRKADFEVRTTVIPQLGEDDLLRMAGELPVLPRYVLNRYKKPMKYRPIDAKRISQQPYTQAEIEQFVRVLSSVQPNTVT